jgi:hypothetical protein
VALKPRIDIETLTRILNESKNLSDSATADLLNKNYTTSKYGKKFNSPNVQAARYSLGIATDTTPDILGSEKIKKVSNYLAKEIKKANDGDKFISKNDIIKKAVIKFDIKAGKRQPKQKVGQPRYRLDSGTYPILNTLESTEQKIDTVLKRMLMDDKPLGDLWYKTLAKRTGLTPQSLTASFKAGKVPTYNVIKDQGADLITDRRLASGAAKQILSELSFSDQLTKADKLLEGRPIISFGQDVGKTFQPKYTIMNFAFRNWDQNLGKGPIKFFDKNGDPLTWQKEFGKKLKGKDLSFSYKGKKYNLQKLSDTDILKKDFAEAYKIANQSSAFKHKKIDNPFKKSFVIDGVTYKPGDQIPIRSLVKKIQVDGYKWSPRYGTIDVLHGPKGVKGEPFTNLRFNTRDINTIEMTLNNSLRAGNITKSQFNKAVKTLNEPFAGLKGKDYEQAIIKRLETQAKDIQKKTFSSFDQFQNIIRQNIISKATNNEDNVCEVVFGVQGQAAGGTVGGGCAKQMELEFDKAPEQTLNKISQSNSPKLKTFAQRALSLLPKLGTPGKIAAGAVAGAAAIGALTYNKELGEFVNPLNDDKASQATVTEWIKDNPVKTVAGTSIGFSAQEIPGAYKKARELGRGRTRSALGITGALKPVLTTFGTPAMTALFEVPFAAKRLEEGETMTEVLTDPLGPALGLTFMEPLSRGAGVIRGGGGAGIMGGIKRAFNPFDLSNVGTARPGLTSKILRMGLSPRVIAGISRLGPYGMLAGAGLAAFDQYQKYQNEEGMLYNLLNE